MQQPFSSMTSFTITPSIHQCSYFHQELQTHFNPAGIIANIVIHFLPIFARFFQIATTLNPYLSFSPPSALTTLLGSPDLQKNQPHPPIHKSQWSNISPRNPIWKKTASPTGFTNIHWIIYHKALLKIESTSLLIARIWLMNTNSTLINHLKCSPSHTHNIHLNNLQLKHPKRSQ